MIATENKSAEQAVSSIWQLTEDEKNFRWALNKFFYTKHKNTLRTAYGHKRIV